MLREPETLLRERGLRVTAQRVAVLRAVAATPHCTAERVAEAVRRVIGTISKQAVYDALGQLSEKGLLRRILLAGSPALYELRAGDLHHHVICRHCGRTADVRCTVGETSRRAAAEESGFRIDEAEVVYWGACAACSRGSPEDGD